jgi:hypothetical protein
MIPTATANATAIFKVSGPNANYSCRSASIGFKDAARTAG